MPKRSEITDRSYGYCRHCDGYRKIAARGMCWMHYQRWRRYGNTDAPVYINSGQLCSVDGCESDAKQEGLCYKHLRRIEKYGDPHTLKDPSDYEERLPYVKDQCVVPDCDEKLEAKELCYSHYQNYRYHVRRGNVDSIFDYLRLRKNNPIEQNKKVLD